MHFLRASQVFNILNMKVQKTFPSELNFAQTSLTVSDPPILTVLIFLSLRTSGRGLMGVPPTPGVRGVPKPILEPGVP